MRKTVWQIEQSHYECSVCGVRGVRMWRVAHITTLFCRVCAHKNEDLDPNEEAFFKLEHRTIGTIGLMLPAVPNVFPDPKSWKLPKDWTCWGFTSVPSEFIAWWWNLP